MNCRQQRRSTAVLGVEKSRAAAMAPVSTAGPHAERDPRVFSKLLPSHPDALLGNTVRMFCSEHWRFSRDWFTVAAPQMVDFCSKQQQVRMIQCREMLNMGLNKKKSRKISQHPMVFLKYFILNFHMKSVGQDSLWYPSTWTLLFMGARPLPILPNKTHRAVEKNPRSARRTWNTKKAIGLIWLWWCNTHLEKYIKIMSCSSLGMIIPYMKWKNYPHLWNQPVILTP